MKKKFMIPLIIIAIVLLSCIITLLCVEVSLKNACKNANALPSGFMLTAHTGCEGTPDNSLASITEGIRAGANTVEFDVRFTADNTPVLAHDEEVPPTAPKLSEAFEILKNNKGVSANVDIKESKQLDVIQSLAQQYGVLEQIFFTGIGEAEVPTVKSQAPLVSYYLNFAISKQQKNDEEFWKQMAAKAIDLGAVGINVQYKRLTQNAVKIMHDNGLKVSVWTVKHRWGMLQALALSPDNITTRKPTMAAQMIKDLT